MVGYNHQRCLFLLGYLWLLQLIRLICRGGDFSTCIPIITWRKTAHITELSIVGVTVESRDNMAYYNDMLHVSFVIMLEKISFY